MTLLSFTFLSIYVFVDESDTFSQPSWILRILIYLIATVYRIVWLSDKSTLALGMRKP